MTADEKQQILDTEHLRLLALGHYVSGGMTVAFSLWFGLIFLMMGVIFSTMPPPEAAEAVADHKNAAPPPAAVFAIFGVIALIGVIYGALDIWAGRCIAKRRHRMFSFFVSIPGLLFIPWGTILSVFTIIVLERTTVKAMYSGDLPSLTM